MIASARGWVAGAACLLSLAGARAEIVENKEFHGPKTTIRYSLWGGADEVAEAKQASTAFVKENPGIRLDISVYPWGQYWAKVQTQMASGLAPDVMAFYTGSFGAWVSRGALYPLDDLVRQDKFSLSDYYPAAIQTSSWNNKLYTLPTDIAIWSLVYSTDRLEESGIPRSEWPSNTQPMSWDQFKSLAKRLTLRNPDGTIAQYGMAAGQDWDLTIEGMYGGNYVDRPVDPTRSTVANNEPLAQAITELFQNQYADATTMGAVPLASGAFTVNSDTIILTPKFAMGTTGPWALPQLRDGGAHFGIAPMPYGTRHSPLINVNSVAIYVHSQHVPEAWKFIKFLTTGEREQLVGKNLRGIPTIKSARDSLIHNKYGIPGCEAFLRDLEDAQPNLAVDSSDITAARDDWLTSLEEEIEAEHDAQLAALPRVNGAIKPQAYQGFVQAMNEFIAKTVRNRLPELDKSLTKTISQDHQAEPGPLVKVVLPILAVLALAGVLVIYVKSIGRTRQQDVPSLEGARVHGAGYWFISPWLFGFCCFVFGPMVASVLLSFTNWNMIAPPHWVGFQNYLSMASDEHFLMGIRITFLYAALVIPISLVGGLVTAGLLTARIRGADLFKAIIYFPALFTGAETAVLWVNMLNKEHGVFNYILSWVHIAPVDWMDAHHAFFSVVIMNVFWIGGAMIIYYAGMKQIPAPLYEAAELDGAGFWTKFMRITIPLLSPVILFMVVMTTIGSFQVFTPALFFAGSSTDIGGPDNSLRFYAVNIYDAAFNNLKMGVACSYAIVLFLIIFAITITQLKVANRFVHTEAPE